MEQQKNIIAIEGSPGGRHSRFPFHLFVRVQVQEAAQDLERIWVAGGQPRKTSYK